MRDVSLTSFDYELLDWLAQDDETTAIMVNDLRNPNNASRFSAEMRALEFDDVDAALHRLADVGLVKGHQEPSDGYQMAPGVTYTWWGLTEDGRRAWEAWDAAQPE
jgi:hypothetical protein